MTASDNRNARPAMFIASSSEGLEVARALEVQLENDVDITTWPDGAFNLTSTNIEALIKVSRTFNFAVLVLTPDALVESRGELLQAPRDNVLFEMGLFMGGIGRSRTFLVHCEDYRIKLPSDLAGVITATYRNRNELIPALGPVATKLRLAMKDAQSLGVKTLSFLDLLKTCLSGVPRSKNILRRLEAIPDLGQVQVWEENRDAVQNIAGLLAEFENADWSDRTCVIFFGQVSTKRLTIYDLLSAFRTYDPGVLLSCLQNVERRFAASHTSTVLSIRDLFERQMENAAADGLARFEELGLIQSVHPAISDVAKHREGLRAKQIRYAGLLPSSMDNAEVLAIMQVMEEVRAAAVDTVRSGITLSPTHIVISCCSPDPGRWMVITATDSDKSRLLLFAETPFVMQKNGALVYYGDPTRSPSSEAVPHWHLHILLSKCASKPYRFILHVHSESLNTLALSGDLELGSFVIPTVPHIDYGTEEMGRMLAKAMIERGTNQASVQSHGQWFVAESLYGALQEAIRVHEAGNDRIRVTAAG